jgi:hypothetical protein
MLFTTNGTLGRTSTATNPYTGETISLAGKRGSTGIFTATASASPGSSWVPATTSSISPCAPGLLRRRLPRALSPSWGVAATT